MSLKEGKQQNIQRELDFSSVLTGEARDARREGTEPSGATNGTENPASTSRLIYTCEEIQAQDGRRIRILLKPLNPDFEAIVLAPKAEGDVRVIGEVVQTI